MTTLGGYDVDDDSLRLKNLLDAVLAAVVSVYDSHGIPVPSRRYWMMGIPAIDCEQLVVSLIQMYLGEPGDQAQTPQKCNGPLSAVLQVSVSRKAPVISDSGKAPAADKIQDSSGIPAVDAMALMRSLPSLDQWDLGGPGMGVIATVDVPPIEGGYQVVNMQLTLVVP